MKFEIIDRLAAASVLSVTFAVYMLTMAPTVSLWDCGEFIACSYRMGISHPPGAPLFILLGRLFSIIPFADDIAYRVNLISVIASTLTITLLYLIIISLLEEITEDKDSVVKWIITRGSAAIGALSLAFSHSFWFNAVESEVYSLATFFITLIVWLILLWAQNSKNQNHWKYLLLIAFILGLAISVHLLTVLALPFAALIFYFKKFSFNLKSFLLMVIITILVTLIIYPGIVKYLPFLIINYGLAGSIFLSLLLIAGVVWAINRKYSTLALSMIAFALLATGYSTYTTVAIRSGLNPTIDMNNPENGKNFFKFINREQYGDNSIVNREAAWKNSPNKKSYSSTFYFIWNYQIKKMYIRYFLWQFVGIDKNEQDWSFKQFFALPFLLGLFGIYYQFRRDPKHALAVLALFFMLGLAIVFYINQPDPQPRERDYSYVGSFLAFSIWIGFGAFFVTSRVRKILDRFKNRIQITGVAAVLGVLFIFVPLLMLAKNYHSHNRNGNYIAWDYSYNILMSCEANAILFTNGDNDTYPLWYLQEVENIRKDVRIVNISLLNAGWYIRQLRDFNPKVPMKITNRELERAGLRHWEKQEVTIRVPEKIAFQARKQFINEFGFANNLDLPDHISFQVKPALTVPDVSGRMVPVLRMQDYMILNITASNQWRNPIYFTVTTPVENFPSGLFDYLRMDGMVYKLVPYKNWNISPKNLENNLRSVYKYRGLDNPAVYYPKNVIGMIQNYRHQFFQLAEYHARVTNNSKALKDTIEAMELAVPQEVIPYSNHGQKLTGLGLAIAAGQKSVSQVFKNYSHKNDLLFLGEYLLHRLNQFSAAADIFHKTYSKNPGDARTLGLLVRAHQLNGTEKKAIEPLERWLKDHPDDLNARKYLDNLRTENTRKNM